MVSVSRLLYLSVGLLRKLQMKFHTIFFLERVDHGTVKNRLSNLVMETEILLSLTLIMKMTSNVCSEISSTVENPAGISVEKVLASCLIY